MPVMWLGWNDDGCFSIQSNSMSYLVTKEQNNNTCLSMRHKMMHSHYNGYTPRESYWFANEVLHGNRIPKVEARYVDNKVYYTCSEKAKEVRFFYISEKMSYIRREKYGDTNSYMKQEWQIMELNPEDSVAYIPENAVGKYVEFTLENGIVLTTPYTE